MKIKFIFTAIQTLKKIIMRFILDINTKDGTATPEEIAKALDVIERDKFLSDNVTSIVLIDETTENQFYSEDEFEVKGEMVRHFRLMNTLSKTQIANFEKELSKGKSVYEIAEMKAIIKLQEERNEKIQIESIIKSEIESEKVETITVVIPSPKVESLEDVKVNTSPPSPPISPLSIDEKHVTVNEQIIIDRMIEDIKESDSDTLIDLIKYMYPVTAKYDASTAEITMTVTEADMKLNDIY